MTPKDGTPIAFTTSAAASLEAFLSVSATSRYQPQLREYAESLLRKECTKPGWCVVGLQAGAPVARAALWALPGQAVPTDVVLIDADWSDSRLSAGQALLASVHEFARDLGAETLRHSIDSPSGAPQYQEAEDARIRLLTKSGYELLRDGLRWKYSGSSQSAPHEPRRVPPVAGRRPRGLCRGNRIDLPRDAGFLDYSQHRGAWSNSGLRRRTSSTTRRWSTCLTGGSSPTPMTRRRRG